MIEPMCMTASPDGKFCDHHSDHGGPHTWETPRQCICPKSNPDCVHPTCPRWPQPGHLAAERARTTPTTTAEAIENVIGPDACMACGWTPDLHDNSHTFQAQPTEAARLYAREFAAEQLRKAAKWCEFNGYDEAAVDHLIVKAQELWP